MLDSQRLAQLPEKNGVRLACVRLALFVGQRPSTQYDSLSDKPEPSEASSPFGRPVLARTEDDVIRIEDLTPREDVSGGRKILLGEFLTPASVHRIPPES